MGLKQYWTRFWARRMGPGATGRIATSLAAWYVRPFYGRLSLAELSPQGFISPKAIISHTGLTIGKNVLVDDGVVIFQDDGGGPIELETGVHLWRDTILQTGKGGNISIGEGTHIQARCQLSAYHSQIRIGKGVEIAPACAFYPYDHGIEPKIPVRSQPLQSKGPIVIEDDAWLGVGVIVLSGVRIGKGAVVGAGAVVTRDVPDGGVASGIPARVVRMRGA
jgi:acetyltransferase-like isoleucine patch superfamily enzyme